METHERRHGPTADGNFSPSARCTSLRSREPVGWARLKWALITYPQFEYTCPMKSNIGNTIIETESFIKQPAVLWSAAELDDPKDYVARNPPCRR